MPGTDAAEGSGTGGAGLIGTKQWQEGHRDRRAAMAVEAFAGDAEEWLGIEGTVQPLQHQAHHEGRQPRRRRRLRQADARLLGTPEQHSDRRPQGAAIALEEGGHRTVQHRIGVLQLAGGHRERRRHQLSLGD